MSNKKLFKESENGKLVRELKNLKDKYENRRQQITRLKNVIRELEKEKEKLIEELRCFKEDLGFDWNDEDFARKLTPEEKKSYFNNVLFVIFKPDNLYDEMILKVLNDETPKYDGKILTEEEICKINCALQIAINTLTILLGNSYIKVREINDKKLFARHKGGTLTPETSLNRDTEEERKIMDSVVNNNILFMFSFLNKQNNNFQMERSQHSA